MCSLKDKFISQHGLKDKVEIGSKIYTLEFEDKWIAQFTDGRNKMVVSKLLLGLLSPAEIAYIYPSELDAAEQARAALAIHTFSPKNDLPAQWKTFSSDFYDSVALKGKK